jgi:hypothetical protein
MHTVRRSQPHAQRQRGIVQGAGRAAAAGTEHQRRLHDVGAQRQRGQQPVRFQLAQVIRGLRAVIGAQRGQLHHAFHAARHARLEQRARRRHMQIGKALAPRFADDAHGVDHHVHVAQARHPVGPFGIVRKVGGNVADAGITRCPARHAGHLAALRQQGFRQPAADKARHAGDQHMQIAHSRSSLTSSGPF